MAAAAAEASSSSRAAATETRIRGLGKVTEMKKMDDQRSPCSVRLYGPIFITRESLKIGHKTPTRVQDDPPYHFHVFDCQMKVKDPSLFRSYVACRDLIHRIVAERPETGKCDLAADNWENYTIHELATTIVDKVRQDTQDAWGVVPAYAFKIQIILKVRLIYSEPKALLLACKDAADKTVPARVPARRKKRRREPAGDLCVICLLEFSKTAEEETARLPCSHAFHSRCIGPWFHRVSTCPICRRDAANNPVRRDTVVETAEGNDDGPPVQVGSFIQHDAVVDERVLETSDGNDDRTSVHQIGRPVRARRQPARLADTVLD